MHPAPLLFATLALALAGAGVAQQTGCPEGRPLVFAAALELSTARPPYAEEAPRLLRGFEMWRDWANSGGGINVSCVMHKVELFVVDIGEWVGNNTHTAEMFQSFIANSSVDFMFGSWGSGAVAPPVRPTIFSTPKIAMLSTARIPAGGGENVFSILPNNDREFSSTLRALYLKGARSIGFVFDIVGHNQREGVGKQIKNGLTDMYVAYEKEVTIAATLAMVNQTELAKVVADLLDLDPDVVIFSVLVVSMRVIWSYMLEQDYFPKAFLTFDSNIQVLPDFGPNMNYMLGTSQWFPDINVAVNTELEGRMGDLSKYMSEVGEDCAEKWIAFGAASGLALQLAIQGSGSLATEHVRSHLMRSEPVSTFYGPIAFNNYNHLQRNYYAVQYVGGSGCGQSGTDACGSCAALKLPRKVVAPFDAAAMDILWPAPDFAERRCKATLQGAVYTRLSHICECPPWHTRVRNNCPGQPEPERCLKLVRGHSTRLENCSVVHTPCPFGSSSTSSAECTPCPRGSFAKGIGLAVCEACRPGYIASETGMSTCTACGRAEFANESGQSMCLACPGDALVASGSGATSVAQCTDCEIGSVLDNGVCSVCPAGYTTQSTSSSECTLSAEMVAAIIFSVALVFIVAFLTLLGYAIFRRRLKKLEDDAEAAVNEKLKLGLQTTRDFGHPLVVIPAANFLALTEEELHTYHEGVRGLGKLMVIDTFKLYRSFKAAGNIVVFFSYQWLSWSRLGPNNLQWRCMRESLEELILADALDPAKLFVWLDVLSIPQMHPALKKLAVHSLYMYAKCANTIIVICPECEHEDTKEKADLQSYTSRVWCRVEQFARCCSFGTEGVYVKSTRPLYKANVDWLKDVVQVFDGNMTCCRLGHANGTIPCDKQSLVLPLCGMYFETMADLTMARSEGKRASGLSAGTHFFLDVVKQHKSTMFPRTISYSVGTDGKTKEMTLFGDLIDRIERRLRFNTASARTLLLEGEDDDEPMMSSQSVGTDDSGFSGARPIHILSSGSVASWDSGFNGAKPIQMMNCNSVDSDDSGFNI